MADKKIELNETVYFLTSSGIQSDKVTKIIDVQEVGQPPSVLVYLSHSGPTGYTPAQLFSSHDELIESLHEKSGG